MKPIVSKKFAIITSAVLILLAIAAALILPTALGKTDLEKQLDLGQRCLVELDYETVEDCSATVDAPAVISVRGYGKFAVHAFDGTTRKGRIRLAAGKYV